ncbi:MAG: outer membrane protein assembly factor BamE [Gammaproteobacteria bacterium]|nr:outer membrane protein assembly factor BamE [Gammaproteobacteria bacterium]MDH4312467.1 outer membrane protein assembly factor BamE [Gammaproteobacteria bacterium]MDH5274332.1 outer membrane protein assembly factor BamE [Gammaproteobacteria bacterium]
MSAFSRAALSRILVVGVALGSAGCVYRPNIQQGNLVKTEDIDQVTAGMTRSQVRYLLGTPMLADPFDPQRWDYIYTLKRGREKGRDRGHFIVRFEGDKVSRVEKPGLPVLPPVNKPQPATPAEAEAPAPAEGTAPARPPVAAVDQSPPAPRPDGTTN